MLNGDGGDQCSFREPVHAAMSDSLPPKKKPVNLPLLIGVVAVLLVGMGLSVWVVPKEVQEPWNGLYWLIELPDDGTIPTVTDIRSDSSDSIACWIAPIPGTANFNFSMMNVNL